MDAYDYQRLIYAADSGEGSSSETTIIFFLIVIAIALIIIIFNQYSSTQEKPKIDEWGYTNEDRESLKSKTKIDEWGYTNEERESLKSKTKPETKVEASTKFERELEEMPSKKSKKDKDIL